MARLAELLKELPDAWETSPTAVARAFGAESHRLIVLDDDPTGTQAVAGVPVLTSWEVRDFAWAFAQDGKAVYVLTNTRSLGSEETGVINREVVSNALAAAAAAGQEVSFLSRGDSTLRGHFPLETDTISETLSQHGQHLDAMILVPAFPAAGRITVSGVHYFAQAGEATPIAQTEFAQDATFGFSSSALADYVAEKTEGTVRASAVTVLDLPLIRGGGPRAVAEVLGTASNGQVFVIDALEDADLSTVALGIHETREQGQRFLYRTGPTFVRSLIGQLPPEPLSRTQIGGLIDAQACAGGLIAVGSHTALTTVQLKHLREVFPHTSVTELDVSRVLDVTAPDQEVYLAGLASNLAMSLECNHAIVHTSRLLRRGNNPDESLRIAREVSAAMVALVSRVLELVQPRFLIAKGGITSSNIATGALKMRHGWVHGPLLPGTISLWEPRDDEARSLPYVVFPGNVGDDDALAEVVAKLSP